MGKKLKKHSTIISKTKTIVLDQENGEVVQEDMSTELLTRYISGNEKFVMVFSDTVFRLAGLEKMAYLTLLYFALTCEENRMRVVANVYYKLEASKLLGISVGTIGNAVQTLYRADFIRRVGNAVYLVNPCYFWKGSITNRSKAYEKYLKLKDGSKSDHISEFENEVGKGINLGEI
jgi:hypothetical protein